MNDISESKIATFFSGMNATMQSTREVQKQYDPIIAFQFNSLNFWRPGENKVSEILAYFLNPKETHGQGDIFLKRFIEIIDLTSDRKEKLLSLLKVNTPVKVTCEHIINNQRRIDILLTFGNDEFALAIENKLWAIDQHQQLNDYSDYLSKRFPQNYCLLYLIPYLKEPSEASISKERRLALIEEKLLQIISYEEEVIDCINDWTNNCRAERVRCFLNDFEQYLRQIILGEQFMSENKMIIDYAINESNVETAIKVMFAANEIKVKIFENFRNKLDQSLRKRFADEYRLEQEYNNVRSFFFRLIQVRNPYIVFGIADYDPDRVHFFVKADITDYEVLYARLKEEFGGNFNSGNWFLNLDHKFNKWDESPEGLLILAQNEPSEALNYITNRLDLISNFVNEYINDSPISVDNEAIQLN